jgi:hypothetical protein
MPSNSCLSQRRRLVRGRGQPSSDRASGPAEVAARQRTPLRIREVIQHGEDEQLPHELVSELGQDHETGHGDPQGNKFDRVKLHGGSLARRREMRITLGGMAFGVLECHVSRCRRTNFYGGH